MVWNSRAWKLHLIKAPECTKCFGRSFSFDNVPLHVVYLEADRLDFPSVHYPLQICQTLIKKNLETNEKKKTLGDSTKSSEIILLSFSWSRWNDLFFNAGISCLFKLIFGVPFTTRWCRFFSDDSKRTRDNGISTGMKLTARACFFWISKLHGQNVRSLQWSESQILM